jgi:hypothetical protein
MDSKISLLPPATVLTDADVLPIVNGAETKKVTVQLLKTGLVPYAGAVSDVNLGEFGVQLGNLEFDNTPTNIPTTAGSMYYNDTDGTLDLILKGGNVKLQIGQESLVRVVNKTATNINLLEANYQAVRVTGAQGQRLKVDLAQSTTDGLSAETIGLVTETINNNQEGFITTNGLVRNINTTGSLQGETWADGDILYLSPTVAGRVTKVKPTAPNHLVVIGYVIYAHATQGTIFVKVDNGYELNELHNVLITSETNNQALIYESSTDLWKNKTVDKTFVGLGNCDNTSDVNKPIGTATQTALNLKQDASSAVKIVVKDATASTAVTGVTTEQAIGTYLIPANTFQANDVMRISSFVAEKTGAVGTCTMRVKVGTTTNFASATTIATYTTSAIEVWCIMSRMSMILRGGNLRGILFGSSRQSDLAVLSIAVSSTTFNPAVDNYIFTSLQLSLGTESVFQSNFLVTN